MASAWSFQPPRPPEPLRTAMPTSKPTPMAMIPSSLSKSLMTAYQTMVPIIAAPAP